MSTYPFKTEPMAHQLRGVKMLARLGGGGLLWDPGTGKTKTVIDYLGALTMAEGGEILAFVAAPLSAVDTWPDEVAKHLPDEIERKVVMLDGAGADKVYEMRDMERGPGLTLVVTNLDVFSQSHLMPGTSTVTVRAAMVDAIRKADVDVVIVDESHRIKGHSSNVSRAFGSLAKDVPRRIIMTGTVAPHSPMDLFAQWRFLNPDRFGTSKQSFENRYAIMGGYRGKQVIGFKNQEDLREKRARDSMVVRKQDALDLPEVTDVRHHITLSTKEEKAYRQMAQTLVIPTDSNPHIAPNAMIQWLRLRQLTSGHITDPITRDVSHFGDSKIKHCADLCYDLTEQGEKVVVFAHFVDDVKRTTDALERRLSCPVALIYGGTPKQERQDIRKKFLTHEGAMVIVAQMRTVSLAINEFVVANHAIYLSMSERRDDYDQSRDRLHRKGQTKPVTYHHLIVRNSIDEALMDSHADKSSLENYLLKNATRLQTLGDEV